VDFDKLIPMPLQVKVGPKKFFCDFINKVKVIQDGMEKVEDEIAGKILAPLCREILKVCRLPSRLNIQKSAKKRYYL
jgi:hypothetical protein